MAGSLSRFNPMARNRIARGCPTSDILNHILKYLPLRDAVRTSILSKEWRYKWLTIPYLVFDRDFRSSLPERYKYQPVYIINRVLAHHIGPIIKFTFSDLTIEDDSIMEIWLKLLSNHPIEDFTIFRYLGSLQEVPKFLFSFDYLKHLSLCSVVVRLPPEFKGFSRLLTLCLVDVDIDSKEFHMFVSKCPALEILDMLDFKALSLVIDAPNLKSFNYDGKFKSFVFENNNIEKISICDSNTGDGGGGDIGSGGGMLSVNGGDGNGGGDDVGGGDGMLSLNGNNLINFFGQLPYVRKLKFEGDFLGFLAKGGVPDKLPNYLNHLTTITFYCFDFGVIDHVTCLLCLIRSSPNLQSLEILGLDFLDTICNSMEAPVVEYLKAQEKCEVSLSHSIKYIMISRFRGLKAEMAFVKVILLKSMLLRELKINCKIAVENVSEVVKALAGFRRASSEAVIVFG